MPEIEAVTVGTRQDVEAKTTKGENINYTSPVCSLQYVQHNTSMPASASAERDKRTKGERVEHIAPNAALIALSWKRVHRGYNACQCGRAHTRKAQALLPCPPAWEGGERNTSYVRGFAPRNSSQKVDWAPPRNWLAAGEQLPRTAAVSVALAILGVLPAAVILARMQLPAMQV